MAFRRPVLAALALAASAWLLLSAALAPAFAGLRSSQRAEARTAARARVTTVDADGRFRFVADGAGSGRVTTVDESGRFRFVVSGAAAPAPAPVAAAPAPAPAPAPVPAPPPAPTGPRLQEIFVTQPSVGERTRMSVSEETTVAEVITEGRRLLGFDQSWIPDSDFKLYDKDDMDSPLTGKLGAYNLRPWGPDGMELHLMFEP